MRRRLLAILLFGMLSACSSRDGMPALAYKNPRDVAVVGLGLESVLGISCNRPLYRDGKHYGYMFVGEDKCYRFQTPRRYQGVWLDQFDPIADASVFFEGRQSLPPIHGDIARGGVWLDMGRAKTPSQVETCWHQYPKCAFAIDFIGRPSTYRGRYGHQGVSPKMILVDQVLAIRELPRPPGPYFKFGPPVALSPCCASK